MLLTILAYKCGFHHISSTIKAQTRKLSENVKDIYPEWAPMRIKFNYDYIFDQTKDAKGCKEPYQSVNWGGAGYFCSPQDFLNESQKSILISTMNNVRNYLESIFSVRRHPNNKIEVKDWNQFFDAPVNEATDCDMFITVVARPYGSDSGVVASSASYDFFEDLGKRPRLAGIMINAREIPSEPQDYTSLNNKFFYHVVHEIFHSLGISDYLYKDYHPPFNYKPYEDVLCNITVKGEKKTFLITPYSHRWAVKHYNVETYVGYNGEKCPSGIELEDMSGIGTELIHPKAKSDINDIMSEISTQTDNDPFLSLTDVSLSMLLDTGNYKINYKFEQLADQPTPTPTPQQTTSIPTQTASKTCNQKLDLYLTISIVCAFLIIPSVIVGVISCFSNGSSRVSADESVLESDRAKFFSTVAMNTFLASTWANAASCN